VLDISGIKTPSRKGTGINAWPFDRLVGLLGFASSEKLDAGIAKHKVGDRSISPALDR
jgi:hypothetical protein